MMTAGRPRLMSYDGAGERYYPTNQPNYRPGGMAGGNRYYAQQPWARPGYNTGYGSAYGGYPGAGAGAYPGYGYGGYGTALAQPIAQPVGYGTGYGYGGYGSEVPVGSHTSHAFESNCPPAACEGLVSRDVQYTTEWVAVPVQKPIVFETYQKVSEVPTQHMVSVENIPVGHCSSGPCGPGYAAPAPGYATPAPAGYGTGYGVPLGVGGGRPVRAFSV